jgi:hypothetical protein
MHEAPLYSAFLVSVQALELVAASPKQGAYFESTVVRRRAESTSAAYEKTSSGYSSLPKALEREREKEEIKQAKVDSNADVQSINGRVIFEIFTGPFSISSEVIRE